MITREICQKTIRPFYNKSLIKIISGIRRSGKSTLLGQITVKGEQSQKRRFIVM